MSYYYSDPDLEGDDDPAEEALDSPSAAETLQDQEEEILNIPVIQTYEEKESTQHKKSEIKTKTKQSDGTLKSVICAKTFQPGDKLETSAARKYGAKWWSFIRGEGTNAGEEAEAEIGKTEEDKAKERAKLLLNFVKSVEKRIPTEYSELNDFFDDTLNQFEKHTGVPHPKRQQLEELLEDKREFQKPLPILLAQCPKGTIDIIDNKSYFGVCELRAREAFYLATGINHTPIFFFDGCPYCQFIASNATDGMKKKEKDAYNQRLRMHLSPEHASYSSCAAFVRFTLVLLSCIRRLVSFTSFGSFASKLLFGDTPSQAVNSTKPDANARKRLGQIDGWGLAMPLAVRMLDPHVYMLVHHATLPRRMSDMRYPNKQDARNMFAFMELQRCMAFIGQELATGNLKCQGYPAGRATGEREKEKEAEQADSSSMCTTSSKHVLSNSISSILSPSPQTAPQPPASQSTAFSSLTVPPSVPMDMLEVMYNSFGALKDASEVYPHGRHDFANAKIFTFGKHNFQRWIHPNTPDWLIKLSKRKPKSVGILKKEVWQGRLWSFRETLPDVAPPIADSLHPPLLRPPGTPNDIKAKLPPLPRFKAQQRNKCRRGLRELIFNDSIQTKRNLSEEQKRAKVLDDSLLRMDRFVLHAAPKPALKKLAAIVQKKIALIQSWSFSLGKLDSRGWAEQTKSLAGANVSGANFLRLQKLVNLIKQDLPAAMDRSDIRPAVFTFVEETSPKLTAASRRVPVRHVVAMVALRRIPNTTVHSENWNIDRVWCLYQRTARPYIQITGMDNGAMQLQQLFNDHKLVLVSVNQESGNCVGIVSPSSSPGTLSALCSVIHQGLSVRDELHHADASRIYEESTLLVSGVDSSNPLAFGTIFHSKRRPFMLGYNLLKQDETMCALVRANVETWCNTRSGVSTQPCSPTLSDPSSTTSNPPSISTLPLRLFIYPADIQRVMRDDKQYLQLNCAVSGETHDLLLDSDTSVEYATAMITERLYDNARRPKPLELDFGQLKYIILTPLPPRFQVLHRTPLRQHRLRRTRSQRLMSVEEDGWCHVPMYLRPPEKQGRSRHRNNQLLNLFRVLPTSPSQPDMFSNNRFLPLYQDDDIDVEMQDIAPIKCVSDDIEKKMDEEKTDEQLDVVPTTCPGWTCVKCNQPWTGSTQKLTRSLLNNQATLCVCDPNIFGGINVPLRLNPTDTAKITDAQYRLKILTLCHDTSMRVLSDIFVTIARHIRCNANGDDIITLSESIRQVCESFGSHPSIDSAIAPISRESLEEALEAAAISPDQAAGVADCVLNLIPVNPDPMLVEFGRIMLETGPKRWQLLALLASVAGAAACSDEEKHRPAAFEPFKGHFVKHTLDQVLTAFESDLDRFREAVPVFIVIKSANDPNNPFVVVHPRFGTKPSAGDLIGVLHRFYQWVYMKRGLKWDDSSLGLLSPIKIVGTPKRQLEPGNSNTPAVKKLKTGNASCSKKAISNHPKTSTKIKPPKLTMKTAKLAFKRVKVSQTSISTTGNAFSAYLHSEQQRKLSSMSTRLVVEACRLASGSEINELDPNLCGEVKLYTNITPSSPVVIQMSSHSMLFLRALLALGDPKEPLRGRILPDGAKLQELMQAATSLGDLILTVRCKWFTHGKELEEEWEEARSNHEFKQSDQAFVSPTQAAFQTVINAIRIASCPLQIDYHSCHNPRKTGSNKKASSSDKRQTSCVDSSHRLSEQLRALFRNDVLERNEPVVIGGTDSFATILKYGSDNLSKDLNVLHRHLFPQLPSVHIPRLPSIHMPRLPSVHMLRRPESSYLNSDPVSPHTPPGARSSECLADKPDPQLSHSLVKRMSPADSPRMEAEVFMSLSIPHQEPVVSLLTVGANSTTSAQGLEPARLRQSQFEQKHENTPSLSVVNPGGTVALAAPRHSELSDVQFKVGSESDIIIGSGDSGANQGWGQTNRLVSTLLQTPRDEAQGERPFNLHDSVSMTGSKLDDDSSTVNRSHSHSQGGRSDKPGAFTSHERTRGRRGISQPTMWPPQSAISQDELGGAGLGEAVHVSLTLQEKQTKRRKIEVGLKSNVSTRSALTSRRLVLKVRDLDLVLRKRSGNFKLHDNKLLSGKKSMLGCASFEYDDAGLMWMKTVSPDQFARDRSEHRSPIKLDQSDIVLLAKPDTAGERGGSEEGGEQREGEGRGSSSQDQLKVSDGSRSGTFSFNALAKTYHSVELIALEYKFACIGERKAFVFQEKKRVNLHPGESQTGVFGRDYRDNVRLSIGLKGGEVFYKPTTQSFWVHVPLHTTSIQNTQHDKNLPPIRTNKKKNSKQLSSIREYGEYIRTCQSVIEQRMNQGNMTVQKRKDLGDMRRQAMLKARRELPHVLNTLPCANSTPSQLQPQPQFPHQPHPQSQPQCPAPSPTCSQRTRPEPWVKGMSGLPDVLCKRDFPVDRLHSVPLVRVLRPSARDRLAHMDHKQKNLLAKHGLWGVSGDPNFLDFFTLYVANSGIVIHIGEGWANRRYSILLKQDLLKSEMQQNINVAVGKLVSEAPASMVTIDWIRNQTISVRDRLKNTPRQKRLQKLLDQITRQLVIDRDELHQVTCTILSAFDIRVLPWLEVDKLVAQKGPRALSKRNKRLGLLLGHGLFRQRLIHHCSDVSIKSHCITWVTEQFTSKLCGCCFRYCGYLRGSRVLKCPHRECAVHLSRDGNAARNIWIWGWLLAVEVMKKEEEKEMIGHLESSKTKSRFTLSAEFWARHVKRTAV